ALVAPLGVGAVQHLQPLERGVSGRVRLLLVSGAEGATELRGELTIRKRFGMLNSALFTVTEERDEQGRPSAFVFRGGGWGAAGGHVPDRRHRARRGRPGLPGHSSPLLQRCRGGAHLRVNGGIELLAPSGGPPGGCGVERPSRSGVM